MKPAGTISFARGGLFIPGRVTKGLPAGHRLIPISEKKSFRGTLRDTFEGHLRLSGKVLLQGRARAVLLDLSTGAMPEQPAGAGWKFAGEIKDGTVGRELLKHSRLRAFLPVREIEAEQMQYAVLDELEKTVVRARTSTLILNRKTATWVSIEPLRGYDEEAGRLSKALIAAGFEPFEASSDYYPLLGIRQALYTSKPEVALEPRAPVFDSACLIAETFLSVARANEPGIKDDLDTEFVHDYRVSLRRIRSLLNLFRGVYAATDSRELKAELAGIMKQTNRLRDLDVYLMNRDRYYNLVPESMYAGLDIMFGVFSRERGEALEQVRNMLQDPEYGRRMNALQQRFGDAPAVERGSAAGEETLHFARRMILKRYNKAASIARSITADTPDERVHELRIECKKLRYLLEFFMPLFPSDLIKPLVKLLKELQDVLGLFNDYSVQRETLATFAEEHPMRGKRGIALAESVGALVATLYQLQLKAREWVEDGIVQFVNRETRGQFRRVFSNKD